MRIGIDLDGVCFDFGGSLSRFLKARYPGQYNISDPTRWEFYLDWGMTEEEFIQRCHEGVDAGYVFGGDVMDMAPGAINFIRSLGHTIHIVTDRKFGRQPQASEWATQQWLYSHGIEYDTLTFSGDKTCVPTDMFIEDKLSNYDALKAAGVDVYLADRPWNAAEDNRKRIKGIQHFATMIGNLS